MMPIKTTPNGSQRQAKNPRTMKIMARISIIRPIDTSIMAFMLLIMRSLIDDHIVGAPVTIGSTP